ncbi:MAG: Ig-like domain-containing protein [Candidatus Daviesbacteria bacterium]|nr:Ig-like domain-containing protein [Candidatus Daviesbacteria bacterium]
MTNVSDATHGSLAVGGSGSDATFITTNTETIATNITFTDFTVGDITNVAVTAVVPVSQVNTVTVGGTVEAGDVFTADLPGAVTATYTVTGGDTTTDNIASGLRAAIEASAGFAGQAFTSGVATNVITLTAKVAGTGFVQISGAANRAAVAQVNTITIGGTVEAGDVFTADLPGAVTATYTVTGGDTTTANIATGLDAAIRTAGGYAGQDFTSGVATNVVTLTAKVAGTGFIQTSGTTNRSTVAQVVTFTPVSVTVGETFRGTIGVNNYDYLAALGNTVATVVAALATSMDADGAVACVDTTSTTITCTASVAGTSFTYAATVVDITAPSAPSTPVLDAADDTGSSSADNLTKNTTGLTFTGTAEAGSTVQLFDGATPLNIATATGGNWSIDLSLSSGVHSITATATDTATPANTSAASSALSVTVDTTVPTISLVTTKDTNGDGKVDTATIVFSEPVLDSSFLASNFTLGGSSGTSFTTGTGDDNTFDVIVSGGVVGTEAKDVTYTQGTGSDKVGNLLANVITGTITEIDSANPVFMFARTFSTTQIDLTFSEDLDGSSLAMSDFTESGYTLTGGVSEPTAGVARLTVSIPFATDATPAVSVVGTVPDLASINAITVSNITPIDGIAPVLSAVNLVSDNTLLSVLFAKTGANIILTFTSSETINTPTVTFTSGGTAVTGSPTISNSGNNWTAFYVANSSDTEGSVAYTINFSDTSTNSGIAVTTGSGSVAFDKTNPEAVDTPTTTTPTNSVNQTWTWTAGSDALSRVYQYLWTIVNNATSQSVSSGTTSSSTLTLATSLAQGVWNLIVQTQDTAGNSSIASTGLVAVDTTDPLVSANNASSAWQTTSPTITLSASDSGGTGLNSSRVRYNWNATANATTGTIFSNGTQINVPSEGTHTLNLYAEDIVGNSNTFNGTYNIDTVAPSSSITAPANGAYSNINPVFTATASDTNGVVSVIFQYKASASSSYAVLSTDNISDYAADWTGVTLVDGTTYNLQTVTTDSVGNTTTTGGVSFIYDTTAPVATADNGSTNSSLVTLKNTALNIADSVLLANDTDTNTLTITGAASPTGGTISRTGLITTFTPTTDFVGNATFSYTLFDGANNSTGSVTVVVNPPVVTGEVLLTPTTNVTTSTTEIVIGAVAFDSTINIPSSVTNATLDLTNLDSVSGDIRSATIVNDITINSATSLGDILVEIPANITISGASGDWTGILNAPTILANSSVSIPSQTGVNGTTVVGVVEIGFGDIALTFNKSVRIKLPGQASKSIGFVRGGTFTEIVTACTTDSQDWADANLGAGADCKITVGADEIVWTKHFSKFVSFDRTYPAQSTPNTSTVCTEAPAGGTPNLISASVSGDNQVTLNWSKASDPVSHYVVVYGLSSGNPQYGNANIGGKETTSYTVNNLSGGTTYYFKVRAGNGCNAGSYSNEISATPGGATIQSAIASGFAEGVLGASTSTVGDSGEDESGESGEVEGESTTDDSSVSGEFDYKAQASASTPNIISRLFSGIGSLISSVFSFFGSILGL